MGLNARGRTTMKAYLVILTLANGAEIAEPADYEECQTVFRELRYADARGGWITVIPPNNGGIRTAVVGFECRPAEHKDGVPSS